VLWGLSYRELFRRLLVSVEERVERHNRDVRLAWLTVALDRMKKPEIRKFLIGGAPVQSVSEQLSVLHALSQRYGGQVRTVHG
jgi:hypothetical protein